MQLREPRRKKHSPLIPPLPTTLPVIRGVFNGFSVVIETPEQVKFLMEFGCYGKGNLSRSFPTFAGNFVRKRQFIRRKEWAKKYGKRPPQKIVVIPDSDSENEDYFRGFKPEFQVDASGVTETLHLTLPEAFYLLRNEKCLQLFYLNEKLTEDKCWTLFREADKYFVQNYICYRHFRGKNWVVKPGIKFGGDFLLYKQGPAFYHASYVVIIDIVDVGSSERETEMTRRSMCATKIFGLNRLCETAGKELLILQILWPPTFDPNSVTSVEKLLTKEIILKRWIPSAERMKPSTSDAK